ncbi:hypothetical protein C8J57DRAFT_1706274 [Mycena rebaudengoi]|nr:hypothetical protein C8J57DRAFT_1706274 [Mycena rebaudengoi]
MASENVDPRLVFMMQIVRRNAQRNREQASLATAPSHPPSGDPHRQHMIPPQLFGSQRTPQNNYTPFLPALHRPQRHPQNPTHPRQSESFSTQASSSFSVAPTSTTYGPPTTTPRTPTDYWHSDLGLLSINRGSVTEYPISISFRPTHGPCTHGVAFTELQLGRGMHHPNQVVNQSLRASAHHYSAGILILEWPGYPNTRVNQIITLIDPQTRRHVTRAALGREVVQHFQNFIEMHGNEYVDGIPGGFFLGVDGVVFEQLRLSEVYSKDGMTFKLQMGLNAHFFALK